MQTETDKFINEYGGVGPWNFLCMNPFSIEVILHNWQKWGYSGLKRGGGGGEGAFEQWTLVRLVNGSKSK
jgi:hypothetical protein